MGSQHDQPTVEPPHLAGDPLEQYEDSLKHLELLAGRRRRIDRAQAEAEQQVLHRAACDYEASRLTFDELADLYNRYRAVARSGFTRYWDERMPVAASKLRAHLQQRELGRARYSPLRDGTWRGSWPLDRGDTMPRAGQSVVYVLYDAANVPCYVGSTQGLRARLRAHRRDGKQFVQWLAYPCEGRQAAYDLESQLLREYKPYLNKRAA